MNSKVARPEFKQKSKNSFEDYLEDSEISKTHTLYGTEVFFDAL